MSVFGNSAVIDQFVRQIERDPPNGSLFSDLLREGRGSSAAFPASAGLDGRMDGYIGGLLESLARRRGSLSVQRVNECLVLLMYFKNNHNFNFLVFIIFLFGFYLTVLSIGFFACVLLVKD